MSREEVGKMTKADALRHPKWTMGPNITVDSATLMNKGLEVIEAMRLYRLPLEKVDVVIHRQSIIHSLVEYRDGAVLAQLGTPDMRLPIRYAMTYPKRGDNPAEPLDLLSCSTLTFDKPDREVFTCLRLAEEAATEGGTACAILNGANEEAVGLFLADKIGFHDISRLVSEARAAVPVVQNATLDEILAADKAAREVVLRSI
jgi:1-deoxy-D-xylulose-5-phosphate reductoisomerase